ncbi:MAG: ABC transporter ATP-binding protein [Dehalococcoidia bacterium]|nr:ABC transporter ATP-binding protein [Dehalococcoidia bacterium]|tara:strand:+ start:26527 stop:27243 length:717 start_codon:yes stop_codon:yes gene_type:complete
MSRVLEVIGLTGGYGPIQILNGIDLHVEEGEFITIIGPNGCGKSTFIKVIFGIADRYEGLISYRGEDISTWRPDQLVNNGIAYVPQVDNIFPSLTVRENLQMGGIQLTSKILAERITEALDMFGDLKFRMNDLGASLSGGERQMLAISRALISNPSFLLLDEPTAALSPKYQTEIINSIAALKGKGLTILIIEQNARLSLSKSDRGYIFVGGEVAYVANADQLLNSTDIGAYFLGAKS